MAASVQLPLERDDDDIERLVEPKPPRDDDVVVADCEPVLRLLTPPDGRNAVETEVGERVE